MTPLQALEQIQSELLEKFDNDPNYKRVSQIMINEFENRTKDAS